MIQAGTYSATLQYLKAVKAAGTKDSDAVAKKLKELPVDDMFAQGGKVLQNAGWCTTSICSRSRSHPSPRSRGTITSSLQSCRRQGVPLRQGQRLPANAVIANHNVKESGVA